MLMTIEAIETGSVPSKIASGANCDAWFGIVAPMLAEVGVKRLR